VPSGYLANAAKLAALATLESLWIKTFDLECAAGFLLILDKQHLACAENAGIELLKPDD
jgi:hypothetical protein